MRYILPNILHDGILTNGRLVARLEEEMATYYGVKHAIALSSCTSGLMLLIQYFAHGGTVAMPSFTFRATADAAYWNGCTIRFGDIERNCTAAWPYLRGVDLAIGVHTFGNICESPDAAVPIIFDAAHCISLPNMPIGNAAVLSLSPTKVITSLEGGIVLTNDEKVDKHVRQGRNYGTILPGLSARMSELHAMTALSQIGEMDRIFNKRQMLRSAYVQALDAACVSILPGFKDFPVLVADAIETQFYLDSKGIETKRYFEPVHLLPYYNRSVDLPRTMDYWKRLLCLPMHNHMTEEDVQYIAKQLA